MGCPLPRVRSVVDRISSVQNSLKTCRQYTVVIHQVAFRLRMLYKLSFVCASALGSWESVIGIAICCGLDSLGIEYRWRQGFPCLSRLAMGPTEPPVLWVLGSFLGVKHLGHDADRPVPSSTEVVNRMELYHHLTSVSP